ncbi:uncharacterized protein METZ01_LOCUS203174 [marine metagenome]|uniref:Uncharacterized protein n=1 Tax=marine metagenome TaxID=408172 RepID=A0A382EI22_9ZZZZ
MEAATWLADIESLETKSGIFDSNGSMFRVLFTLV